jgi:putative methionine-R-sulfoxide reductase with GAF domain
MCDKSLPTYLSRSGLGDLLVSAPRAARHFSAVLESIAESSDSDTEISWEYHVPELGEGGSCSLHGKLAPELFDLATFLGGRSIENKRLLRSAAVAVQYYQSQTKTSHWFGVYLKAPSKDDSSSVLVKLSYFGSPSRALFPLTEEFALISNNSSVGLSGHGRIINNIKEYVKAGNPYYTCDPKVKSEACLPLLSCDGDVIGIIDSESFLEDAFIEDECDLLMGVTLAIAEAFATRQPI